MLTSEWSSLFFYFLWWSSRLGGRERSEQDLVESECYQEQQANDKRKHGVQQRWSALSWCIKLN